MNSKFIRSSRLDYDVLGRLPFFRTVTERVRV